MDAAGGQKTPRRLRDLQGDKSGMALIYVTAALPVIIGLSVLAIDYGRLSTLQSSLQHGGDALALAAAAELDLRPDAIARSKAAIAQLITTNESLFATSVVTIDETNVETCYLAALPASDATPITSADCLPDADATEMEDSSPSARFVQVKVNPQNFETIMPAAFLGGPTAAQTSAEAVAGFEAAVCNFTPLLMCNPFEPPDATLDDPAAVYNDYGLYAHIATEAGRREQIALKMHDSQWSPGNFGFLQPYAGPGAKNLMYSIASVTPQACFRIDNIALTTEPGNIETLKKAFNVRFDLFPNGNIGGQSAMSYPPAANVRKGYIIKKKNGSGSPNNCNDNNPVEDYTADGEPDFTIAMGLPLDSCHRDDSCVDGAGDPSRVGSGDWGGDNPGGVAANDDPTIPDFYQYWRFNHPTHSTIPTEADLGVDVNDDGDLDDNVANDVPPSRYTVYRYELAQGWESDQNANANAAITYHERGTPQCNPSIATDSPDRRIIYGAIINCRANDLAGGKNTGIIALAFGKFFMTQPMKGQNASDTVLYTELIDIAHPGAADGVARDIVQLYR